MTLLKSSDDTRYPDLFTKYGYALVCSALHNMGQYFNQQNR